MCPFCYIGKRKFEAALEQFEDREAIEIVWKSFQLNPDQETDPEVNLHQHLADVKGWSLDYARQMNDYVTGMAREVGLDYHLDKAVVANSFDAHRLIQFAKQQGLGDAMEERLFKAYFTEGANTADHETLLRLGTEIGLPAEPVRAVLASGEFAGAVQADIHESRLLGVRGVPFFVFNRKYAVSGAQAPETFLGALRKAFPEWRQANPVLVELASEGAVCGPDGECN